MNIPPPSALSTSVVDKTYQQNTILTSYKAPPHVRAVFELIQPFDIHVLNANSVPEDVSSVTPGQITNTLYLVQNITPFNENELYNMLFYTNRDVAVNDMLDANVIRALFDLYNACIFRINDNASFTASGGFTGYAQSLPFQNIEDQEEYKWKLALARLCHSKRKRSFYLHIPISITMPFQQASVLQYPSVPLQHQWNFFITDSLLHTGLFLQQNPSFGQDNVNLDINNSQIGIQAELELILSFVSDNTRVTISRAELTCDTPLSLMKRLVHFTIHRLKFQEPETSSNGEEKDLNAVMEQLVLFTPLVHLVILENHLVSSSDIESFVPAMKALYQRNPNIQFLVQSVAPSLIYRLANADIPASHIEWTLVYPYGIQEPYPMIRDILQRHLVQSMTVYFTIQIPRDTDSDILQQWQDMLQDYNYDTQVNQYMPNIWQITGQIRV